MGKPLLELDGDCFDDLDGFWTHTSSRLGIPLHELDSPDKFNDALIGGYGTPDEGFVLVWTNSDRSRVMLGHEAMVHWLRHVLSVCHPDNRSAVAARLAQAEIGDGETVFDMLVDIIRSHKPPAGGRIELILG
jgi:hypothetical protein